MNHLIPEQQPNTTRLNSGFIFADGFSWGEIEGLCTSKAPEGARLKALSEANANRLVKRSKSPTRASGVKKQGLEPEIVTPGRTITEIDESWCPKVITEDGRQLKTYRNEAGAGKYTTVQYRQWSDEYRISTRTEGAGIMAPPAQSGQRVTDMLSGRGARKISESCFYNSVTNGGFTTFLTLTLDTAARARIMPQVTEGTTSLVKYNKRSKKYVPNCTWMHEGRELNDHTIQKELSRFLDGIQKVYQRGFIAHYKRGRKSYENGNPYTPITFGKFTVKANKVSRQPTTDLGLEGNSQGIQAGRPYSKLSFQDGYYTPVYFSEKLHYCWVVEVPKNEQGHDNPHCHLLMRWTVPFEFFPVWAARLEKLWGQGFAHLEKIKEPENAGAYMAKAAGYMTKGEGSDQGTVRGNRYGISKNARAPEWVTLFESELGIMGSLIYDMHNHYEETNNELKARRSTLSSMLEDYKEAPEPEKYKKKRLSIGKALEKVRTKIKSLPFRTGKYQLLIKGVDAFTEFFTWATNAGEMKPTRFTPHKPPLSVWNPNERPTCYSVDKIKKRQHRRWFMPKRLFIDGVEWKSIRQTYWDYSPPEKQTFAEEYYNYAY